MYDDSDADETVHRVARRLQRPALETSQRWCIFDHTVEGLATANALSLLAELPP